MFTRIFVCALFCSSALLLSHAARAEEPKALYIYEDATVSGSKLTFAYKPESLYEVNCMPGHITDITLKPGEQINHIVAGDTAQWLIDQSTVNNVTHVYIKPIKNGIRTNLIINSSLHSYRLVLNSEDKYYAIVCWDFGEENRLIFENNIKKAQEAVIPEKHKLNFEYQLSPKKSSLAYLTPVAIFDDGIRTYIRMPPGNRYDLPVLYLISEDNKLSIINYRVKKNMFIADKVFVHGRLLFSKDIVLDFYAKNKKAGAYK